MYLPEANLGIRCLDERRRFVDESTDPYFSDMATDLRENVDEFRLASEIMVPKPQWFKEDEAVAREFMARLGHTALPDIYVLGEGKQLRALGMVSQKTTGEPEVIATTDWISRFALVRESKIAQCRHELGAVKSQGILVHELLHLTETRADVVLARHGRRNYSTKIRTGFIMAEGELAKGKFLEEALCTYFEGLFVRSQESAEGGLVSFAGVPPAKIPSHYKIKKARSGDAHNSMAGYDGYAMELLMYGCEQRGILSKEDFVAALLQTRQPDTKATGMRSIFGAMNQLQPKLYGRLRALEYSRDNWRAGCDLVYQAVTDKTWAEAIQA